MITLSKDKMVFTNHFNPGCSEYVKEEIQLLHRYLNETVELSDDFTFEDLFKILEGEKEIFDVIFSSQLGHYPLQLYIDEIKKSFSVKDEDEVDYLEIRRFGEYWGRDKDIEIFVDFGGESETTDISYGVGFTAVNELKYLPLRLNENFEISEIKRLSKLKLYFWRLLKKISIPWWDNPFTHTYVKGKTKFSVYELISAVLYEITFYGPPDVRDAKLEDLEKTVEETKEFLASGGDIDDKFVKWEDVKGKCEEENEK